MTDKEAMKLALDALESDNPDIQLRAAIVLRTALKERLAQPEQEPEQEPVQYKCTVIDNQHPNGIPLEQWVKPPQRTWVGLTDEEFHEACWESYVDPATGECSTGDREYAVRWTEAKLKEKNT